MNSLWLVIGSLIVFSLAYKYYGGFIAKTIFKANAANKVPSEELKDDVDYVPTNKEVLFGHHFASIAGTGPIVGPAIAVIWGWVPALIWIILGSIFAGAVHDYASLMISVRNKGKSIGEVSRDIINERVRHLFLFVILFSLWIVVAIFGMVMAVIFAMYPQSVIPVWIQIPIAIAVGTLAFKKGWNIKIMSMVSVAIMYFTIFIGVHFPFTMPGFFGINPMSLWIIILFIYAYIASVLPVWTLLQPRDYVNSHQLIIGLVLIILGIFISRPEIVAPAIQISPRGAPPLLPFLFITIACGAISGFHSLVSSGTSSKQLKSEKDIHFIGYGGMLTEGLLAVLVLVSVAAGIGLAAKGAGSDALSGLAAWKDHYSSWAAAQGLSSKVTAFVDGSANMLTYVGIPIKYGQALIGVLIASFAGTTLDTATRIQRYLVHEFASEWDIKPLQGRYKSTAFVIIAAAFLAFSQGGGKGALMLWPVFGISNQLLAGMVLLVVTLYLMEQRGKTIVTFIPMLFMIFFSLWGLVISIMHFFSGRKWMLFIISIFLICFELWMIIESLICAKKRFNKIDVGKYRIS